MYSFIRCDSLIANPIDLEDFPMYAALANPLGQAWQHSRAEGSIKRGLRSNRILCCDGPRRWSPLEEGKQKVEQVEQKAQQLEQVIEHRMPDTQNLCVSVHP